MNLEEKTLKTKIIYDGEVLRYRVDEVELPNKLKAKREIIEHPGAVAIVALTNENKVLMVKQYRKAIESEILEIPAGKLEVDENPYDCAFRELEEETGYKAGNMNYLFDIYMMPGFTDAKIYYYIASDLILTKTNRDFDEFMEVVELDLKEVSKKLNQNEFVDAKTIIALNRLVQLQNKGELNE